MLVKHLIRDVAISGSNHSVYKISFKGKLNNAYFKLISIFSIFFSNELWLNCFGLKLQCKIAESR